jgi:hypothetical protein
VIARGTSLALLGVILLVAGSFAARAGVATDRFVQKVGQCQASQRGTALYQCVGDALQQMANRLQRSTAPGFASEVAPAMARAGTELAAARAKPEALSVLSRAQAVVRGLAAKTGGSAGDAYTNLARALVRARAAIAAGG